MSFLQSLVLSLISSAVLTSAVTSSHSLYQRDTFAKNSTDSGTSPNQPASDYEYIVVGSGAGGGPLAARLALNGKRVLLIEAGEDNGKDLLYNVPAFHAYATEDPAQAWGYYVQHYADPARAAQDSKMTWTTPSGQLFVGKNPPAGSTMKGIFYPRAGTLGGCTAHNALVNMYPHEKDWDHIVDITGDNSWNHRAMRKVYQKLEKLDYYTVDGGHGYNGWLGVGRADITLALNDTKILAMAVAAAAGAGMGIITGVENLVRTLAGDANGETIKNEKEGVYNIPLARYDNKRNGAREFINEVYNAKDWRGDKKYPLDISFNTLVTKVTFDKSGSKPKATGVDVLFGKSLYKADPRAGSSGPGTPGHFTASKEVILAGGAFNTPQLLKLSGIGAKEELARFGIPVISGLRGVGTNLQDHFEIGVSGTVPTPFAVVEHCTFDKTNNDWCLEDWYDQKGPYSTNGFLFAIIHKSSVASGDIVFGDDPDLLIFGGLADFKGYYPGYSNDVYKTRDWTWIVLKGHTGNYGPNAGTVKLRSADPTDTPEILFNFFDTGSKTNGAPSRDLQAMTEGVELSRNINDNVRDPLTSLISSPLTETRPGENIRSNSQMKEHIKEEAWSHHASCTCPIGADNDPWAVLDSKLRVRGTLGLRVADASVFPRIPGFFVAAPTYMIGEKAAEIILEDRFA